MEYRRRSMQLADSLLEILEQRYPELFFLIRFADQGIAVDETRATSGKISVDLSEIEALYICGIGHGTFYPVLESWLAENRERELVIIEDSLSHLINFLQGENAYAIISHPQIHIRLLLDKKRLPDFLRECAYDFPLEKIEIIPWGEEFKQNKKHFSSLRLQLLRFTVVAYAEHIEDLHYHLFFKNLLPNYMRLSSAFFGNQLTKRFTNIPAIICGAGPSLSDSIAELKKLENKALIFAGGSTITALTKQGIIPHLALAIDPNLEEFFRLKHSLAFEVPFLYGNRLYPDVFTTCNGPHGYLHTQTGGASEAWIEHELHIPQKPLYEGFDTEAMSITTICLQLAYAMGCNPVILVGVDLAFTGNQSYAPGVLAEARVFTDVHKKEMRSSERIVKRKDRKGRFVNTLVKWVMESASIGKFAKKNNGTTLINATSGGIGVKDIPYQPLEEIPFPSSFDLRGLIHQEIESTKFSFTDQDVKYVLQKIRLSLKKCLHFISEILVELARIEKEKRDPETGKIIFYQMEIESEEAYTCLLEQPLSRLKGTLLRKHRPTSWNATPEEKNQVKWDYFQSKWAMADHMVTYYLDLIDKSITI